MFLPVIIELRFQLFKHVLLIKGDKIKWCMEILVPEVKMFDNSFFLILFSQVGNYPERDPFEEEEI
jgi:hypothetical protein